MPTTHTARMLQIADDLREIGAYTSANSVDAITTQRDNLLEAIAPFLTIEEGAAFSYGQVRQSDIAYAKRLVKEITDAIAQ